jgi:small basic protein (TIGR04137 family)
MSVDRSLKIKGALKRHRNVLTRAERIEQLKDEERWSEGDSLFALPKVAHRKSHAGKKVKEEAAEEVVVTPEAAEAEAATPEAGAAPTKAAGAKPAAGATPAKEKSEEKGKKKGKEKGKEKTAGKT